MWALPPATLIHPHAHAMVRAPLRGQGRVSTDAGALPCRGLGVFPHTSLAVSGAQGHPPARRRGSPLILPLPEDGGAGGRSRGCRGAPLPREWGSPRTSSLTPRIGGRGAVSGGAGALPWRGGWGCPP